MVKKYFLSFLFFCFTLTFTYGQGSETFTNLNAPGGAYGNGSYVGDNTVTWTYNGARTVNATYNITGTTIGFGSSGTRNVSATSDANGVGDVTYSVSRYFTGGTAANRSIEVYINGNLYDSYTLAAEGPIYTRTFTASETGAVLIEFRSTGSRQIVIDDVSWTSALVSDPDLSLSGILDHGSSCLSTPTSTIQYTITNSGILPAAGVAVTSDNAQFVVSNLSSTAIAPSGTATYDVTFTPTAVGAQAATITVTSTTATSNSPTIDLTGTGITIPPITVQPLDQVVSETATATFNITAPTASSYQWQVSTDGGGTWNNVATGTGGTTASYSTVATTTPMSGNQYWCIVSNACGTAPASNAALLTVNAIANVVITEIMYNTSGTDDEWIEICNVSGITQTLNDYTIEVNGSLEYTFPTSGVTITNGNCITVILGDNGVAPFNPNCPFTSIYSNSPAMNTLANSSRTITIIADDGSSLIDSVTYNSADGANGNDATLHVIDASLDNSSTATNWQEVPNGGSAGINQLTPLCLVPDINVEGNIGTFPDIASDGSNIPVGFNNTLFAATAIGVVVPPTKSYRIQNTGAEVLNVSSIILGGANAGDFALSGFPTTINPGAFANFNITFDPLTIGERTAIVTIISDDPDGSENPYDFNIKGTGVCTSATIGVSSFAPLDGPVGTEVTINGNGFSAASTVTIGGLPAPVVSFSATELVVEIPAITNSGPFTITDGACFTITSDFILTSNNAGCGLTELIMSEIYDLDGGSLGYIEIYNGTGNTIDLSSYYVRRYGDAQDLLDNNYVDYYFSPSQDFIDDGQVLYGKISTDVDTASPNFDFANVGGFAGVNGEDIFHLYNATTLIDVYTVPDNDIGYLATRDINTLGPNATENPGDWTHSNSEITTGLGTFGYIQVIDRPIVSNPVDVSGCIGVVEFEAISTAGNLGNLLTYQWYYNEGNGTDLDWEVVSAGAFPLATLSGINGDTLTLAGAFFSYSGYQFYCLVTEDGACGIASNAAQLKLEVATWDGLNWNWNDGTLLNTIPTLSTYVIINGNYDSSVGGPQTSFSACSLTVNPTFSLSIQNNTYVEVQNDIIANGDITVFPQGSVVQINDLASVTATGIITVQKETSLLNTIYDYTYWSSPVVGETVENVFSTVQANRRFIFNAANFVDNQIEIANTNTFTPGQDDIDDDGDDWVVASGIMLPGVGYAATPSVFGPPLPTQQQFPFVGAFNNGVITPSIVNASGNVYNDWNFIGNPYPSAISTAVFFSENTGVANNIFLWSQATPADANASGDEGFNFSTADYAVINASGVNVAGGSGIIPNNFVPSGQGFFIEALSGTAVTFNNSMRVTGNNDQFFRTTNQRDVLWLNLNSDNGAAKQIAVAHIEGATDNYDGSFFDVKENLSTGIAATIYSTILDNVGEQFVIQGKNRSSLNENEIINIGFKSIITVPTLYTISIAQFEGDFYTNNAIYIKDDLLNTIHNLKDSDYTFTSEVGEFNDRFDIVFRADALSINDNLIDVNDLNITELANGNVQFNVGKTHTITNVEIMDVTGRRVYVLKGNNSIEVYELSNLSKAPYIAKVTLSNGQIITKKAIKQY